MPWLGFCSNAAGERWASLSFCPESVGLARWAACFCLSFVCHVSWQPGAALPVLRTGVRPARPRVEIFAIIRLNKMTALCVLPSLLLLRRCLAMAQVQDSHVLLVALALRLVLAVCWSPPLLRWVSLRWLRRTAAIFARVWPIFPGLGPPQRPKTQKLRNPLVAFVGGSSEAV